jgi:hypothetical protein
MASRYSRRLLAWCTVVAQGVDLGPRNVVWCAGLTELYTEKWRMKNRRISLRPWAVICLVGIAVPGCTTETKICPGVAGSFQPLYEQRSGNCGVVAAANNVKVDNNITIENYFNVDVETETIVKGCTVNMKQIVRNKTTGRVESIVQGSTLEVEGANQLSGMVTLTRFNVMDVANPATCTGEYNLTLTKSTQVIGGATM